MTVAASLIHWFNRTLLSGNAHENEMRELGAVHRRYRHELALLHAAPIDGQYLPYPEEWTRSPKSVAPAWLPYSLMLEEFAREIANSVNDLTNHVDRLRAW